MQKHLFFDLDGTLTDSMPGIVHAVQYALRHFGIEPPADEALRCFVGPPMRESFMEFYGMSAAEAERAVAVSREYFIPKGMFENELYEGIAELLAATGAAGYTHIIATSKPQPFAERIIAHFGLTDRFRLICGSLLDGSRTTKSQVISHALRTLGITPDEAIMIGDRRYDIEGAAEFGMESIAAGWGYAAPGELEAARPTHFVRDVAALRRLLLKNK
ncbi:HAD hydrolase-like protein [Alistipes sp.]|uniref:HAD hydrolase-like protein n=1 Tax=Alistipes sp. TaxID=1872444 RepID=UPI0025BA96EE|nr:HAD hydrolase-like protein [Alistipes sp.]MCI7140047.1 HAD hydrolase-like protein [Alistipes sp.]MDY5396739.1 HAD hydrolase-like protein [Alistipes sp.]